LVTAIDLKLVLLLQVHRFQNHVDCSLG
jgi:hypothetical protein